MRCGHTCHVSRFDKGTWGEFCFSDTLQFALECSTLMAKKNCKVLSITSIDKNDYIVVDGIR